MTVQNQNIIGQDALIKELGKIFDIFKVSQGTIRPHFFLTGESGTGKTLTISTLAAQKELNFIELNAAALTKEGVSGNSLSKALSPMLSAANRLTVVFVDEFDKLFISGNNNESSAHESTTGVQNEFLKVLESNTASVFGDYGKYLTVSMKNTIFVFAGAFNNEKNITLDRLRDLGIKTEFLGRVGLVYNTAPLALEDMYNILEESPLFKKYLTLFEDVDAEQTMYILKEYIRKNFNMNTLGARMVNTIIHQFFIKGKLEDGEVEKITFQEKLKLN